MQLNRYIIGLVALLSMACSTSEIEDGAQSGESGSLLMSFSLTRSSSSTLSSDDLLESATLRIYNSTSMGGGLVRYYKDLREDIIDYMAVGDYSAQIQIGEETASTYSIDDVSYSGQSDIEIVSRQTADITMDVTMQNTMATIVFDDTLNDHYTGYYATISAANSADDITESTPSLTFDGTYNDGYLILPDGVDNLVWRFYDNTGLIDEDLIEGAQRACQYKLTFKHTDYLDVSGMKISIDGVEVFDDIIGFKPQPVINGYEFDDGLVQNYTGEGYSFEVTTLMAISSISASVAGQSYSWGVDEEVAYDADTKMLTLSSAIFDAISQGGVNIVSIEVCDNNNSVGHLDLQVAVSGLIGVTNEDFWNNTATMSWYTTTPASQVDMQYRKSGEEWSSPISATSTDGGYTWSATSTVEWSYVKNDAGLDTWQLANGYMPSTEYEFQMIADEGEAKSASRTSSDVEQEITSVSNSALSCYTSSNSNATFWASGNNSYSSTLCSYDSATGAADLNSQDVSLAFAAGNLYTGAFEMTGTFNTSGCASFGQKYDWVARPKSLKFNYKVTVGLDDDDRGRIFIAIVDWTSRRSVTTTPSGSASGSWEPTSTTSLTEGDIIGYGSVYFDDDVSTMTDYELPIYYYDTTAKPTSGNYSIVISATASYDGEHLKGSPDSELWVKDFKFGY